MDAPVDDEDFEIALVENKFPSLRPVPGLRELYEVTSPELDALVEIAVGSPGVLAGRMTGAGVVAA